MRTFVLTLIVGLTALTPSVRADDNGRFGLAKFNPFRKKADPAAKVKQLTETLRTDPDEKKRKGAAEELQETEAKLVPEVIPVLIASIRQDPSATVRASVAETIGKLKPVTASVGAVLETSASNDPSDVVRRAAQTALVAYQANGYRSTQPLSTAQTNEPPFAKPKPPVVPFPPKQIIAPVAQAPKPNPLGIPTGINRGPQFGETSEPPLARQKTLSVETPSPSIPMPVPPMPVEPLKKETETPPPSLSIPTPLPTPTPTPTPAPAPAPAASPPLSLPAPVPLPSLPSTPPRQMPSAPAKPVVSGTTIPTPPPSSNPGF
ncbi:MAG: HEAT repeat domain-containing protein [Gemmataceae bacterium]